MKRLAAFTLAGLCLLGPCADGYSQALKERSLSDAPPAEPAPAKQPAAAPAATPPAAPAIPPPPAATQAPAPSPPPATTQAPAYEPAPSGQPFHEASPTGGTSINGSTAVSPPPPPPPPPPANTYNRQEINREVMGFFESGSRGLAEIVAHAFQTLGQPDGFIKGNEAGGALVVGLRYGTGTLYLKGKPPVPIYWQSPSLGIDLGVNAVKVFTLVYGLHNPNELFQRFPGVEGSAYVIGGFGMNYQRTAGITLAPIRFGVGLRLGANIGYQHYTRTQDINPF